MAYRLRFRSFKLRCVILFLLILLIYLCVSYLLFETSLTKQVMRRETVKERKNLDNIVVHIDFKGAPVKLTYLQRLLPKLIGLGVTGLLLEYEDMFPYEDKLVNLSSRYCYKKNELKQFLTYAVRLGFDIFPLVQTFGHMEHVLKLKEFQHLRETPFFPDSICPSKAESQSLIRDMLEQVVTFHENILPLKYIHIGCDEVYHINECKKCKDRYLLNIEIYLRHVRKVADIVNELTPDTVVLVWDDMYRDIPINLWHSIDSSGMELVYWDYAPTLTVSHVNMMKYHKKFQSIWIASAYKGADGRLSSIPDLLKRFYNTHGWMKFTKDYKFGGENDVYNFEGIILTGWSRYSHMDPPCDLLQVALPSLYVNLLLIQWAKKVKDEDLLNKDLSVIFTNYIHKKLMETLNCTDLINLEYFDDQKCNYDGVDVYHALENCDNILTDIMNSINDMEKGMFAINYYAKSHYINMNQVVNHVKWCNNTFKDLLALENSIKSALSQYYDNHFIAEYINYRLYNTKMMLLNIFKDLQEMLSVENWKRRPDV